jgi:lactoylglutathione lyase
VETPRIGYVNLFVRDLARSLAFYRDVLGLAVDTEDGGFGYASLDAGPIRLGLAEAGDAPHADALVGRHTGVGLCVKDLESVAKELEGRGVAFDMPPARQPWGGFMATIRDPDGNVLYLDQVALD